ncbi:NACHT domain-containing NTPase [bacterium RCC_150]
MEPISAVAASVSIASGTSAVLQAANKGVRSAYRRARLSGTIDQDWLTLDALSGQNASFTAVELTDVHLFLASEAVKPVLALLAVGTVLGDADEVVDGARKAFLNESRRWAIQSKTTWAAKSDAIFDSIVQLFHGVLPNASHSEELTEEIEAYSDFIGTPLKGKQNEGAHRTYVGRLLALTMDLDALRQTSTLSEELAEAIRAGDQEQIIGHAEVDSPVTFDDLYVSRDFIDVSSESVEDSGGLVSSGIPFRVLLMGSPGAGKSTFVKFLTAGLANPQLRSPTLPSVVIKCREYAREGFSGSLVSFASKQLTADLRPVSDSALEGLLLTGKIAVIFDGLDEITDLPRRQDIVKRIHRFTSQFPTTSVLVTTREVGYNSAALSTKVFRGVRLQEFSLEQIEEYCQRWFAKNSKDHLVEHFVAESEAVSDLRANPLLLSLLCILYRDSGAIPANRRGIYSQCAQLLFHKWDAHRQIKHFEVLPDYTDRLMEEIARWIYTSPSAQTGLEEQIIVKTMSQYMVSDLGFLPSKAEPTARDFLDFCAGRAWLLGVTGTSKHGGNRIFSFTHRTFYEFFAAEAFARNAENATDMATLLRKAYEQDSTSLLPELLIQSFDQTRARGATNVFISLCDNGAPPALLLRLMDGANLASFARSKGFALIMHGWNLTLDSEVFTALLQVSGPARDQFQSEYLLPAESSLARRKFLYGWASFQLAGSSTRFNSTWAPIVDDMVEAHAEELAELPDPVVMNWLLGKGVPARDTSDIWEYFVCFSLYGWAPGIAWWLVDGVFNTDITYAPSASTRLVIERLVDELNGGATFPQSVIARLRGALEDVQAHRRPWIPLDRPGDFEKTARTLLAYIVFAIAEEREGESELLSGVARCWPELTTILVGRASSQRRRKKLRSPILSGPALSNLPSRLQEWVNGAADLVDFSVFDDDPLGVKYRHIPPVNFEVQFGLGPRRPQVPSPAIGDRTPPRP